MYVLLYGAKKNAGDFLIFERARKLVETYQNTTDFLEIPRWQKVDEYLPTINQKAKAVIICGGPGYASNFYPNVYPLTDTLSNIKVPIIPLAVGWSGVGTPDTFQFTQDSLSAIREIHSRIERSSVRDVLTEKILKNSGIENTVMTGCAAWYYLPLVDKPFVASATIRRVVVTSPAKNANLVQAVHVLRLVKKVFPDAERFLVFHRGILPDKHTTIKTGALNVQLAVQGYLNGYRVLNASYSTKGLGFYQDCDLHVGYRVHAHLSFLSYRKASILLQEDGRGLGQSLTLGTKDISVSEPNLIENLSQILCHHLDTHFDDFQETVERMTATHRVMREFVTAL
jgi:hypothetical protein